MPQNSPAITAPKYPLLEELLSAQGETLKALYSNRDVAKLFGVSVRAIQEWVAKGLLDARDLPGRARFLSQDLEEFIANSTRKKARVASDRCTFLRHIRRDVAVARGTRNPSKMFRKARPLYAFSGPQL